jgi:hypothetical protein
MMTEGGDQGEWRKRITAALVKAPVAVVIDNVRERLDSSNLSAAADKSTLGGPDHGHVGRRDPADQRDLGGDRQQPVAVG